MHEYRRFIQAELDARGWRQADLVRSSGLSRQLISNILRDDRPALGQMPEESTITSLAKGFGISADVVRRAASRALAGYSDSGEPLRVDLASVSDAALVAELHRRLAADTGTQVGTWALSETDMLNLAFAADEAEYLVRDLEYRDEEDDIAETLDMLVDFIDATEYLISNARRVASTGVGGKPRLLDLQEQVREASRRRRRRPTSTAEPQEALASVKVPSPRHLQPAMTPIDELIDHDKPGGGQPTFDSSRMLAAMTEPEAGREPGGEHPADVPNDDFEGR